MKELKLKSLKANLGTILIWLLFGIAMLVYTVPSLRIMTEDPIPLEEVDFNGDIEGLYVSGTLEFIYDWYCETTEGTTTESREYIIDAGELYYMGMKVMKSDMKPAEALMEACYDYMDGYGNESAVEAAQYEIKGTINKMPYDSQQYYHDYFDWSTMSAEERATFLPYYLEVNKAGSMDATAAIGLTVVAAIFLLLAILFFIWPLTGRCQKNVMKYIKNSASPDMARERVENFLRTTPEVNHLRYNQDFICGGKGATTAFGETPKLAWAYQTITKHKRYFITVSKTYALVLCFADGTSQTANMKNEQTTKIHLERLSELCPRAIVGYSDELSRLFNKDLNGFLNLRYNKENNEVV